MNSEKLRKEHKEELKEKRITEVMEATGWDEETAYAAYRKAYKKHGIKFSDYMKHKFYAIPEEEHAEKWEQIQKEKKNRKENQISTIMEVTGWSHEKAEKSFDRVHHKYGIKFSDYITYELYNVPETEVETIWKKHLLEKKEKKAAIQEHAIIGVMNQTGWDREKVLAEMADAKRRLNCRPLEYYENRFFEMTKEQQGQVAIGADNKKIAERYDTRTFARLQKNKVKTNEYFSEYIRRPWTTNRNVTKREFLKTFANCEKIIYKPLLGNKGGGVEVFSLTENTPKEVYKTIMNYPVGIVEECITQHAAMAELCPDSVNTLRVVTLVSKEKPITLDGKHMDFVYVAVRVGRVGAVVDNFHSGGMCAAVDLKTGKIVTDAADLDCHVYPTHPDTGTAFKGFQIPFFAEAMELVKEASKKDLVEGLVGWDVAFTKEGPILIEVNTNPGAVLLSTPYAAEKIPTKQVLTKYLFEE